MNKSSDYVIGGIVAGLMCISVSLVMCGCENVHVQFQAFNSRSNVQDGESLVEQQMEGGGTVSPDTEVTGL